MEILFRVCCLLFLVLGFGFEVPGLRFRVSGLLFQVCCLAQPTYIPFTIQIWDLESPSNPPAGGRFGIWNFLIWNFLIWNLGFFYLEFFSSTT